jgi:hypothetical protein
MLIFFVCLGEIKQSVRFFDNYAGGLFVWRRGERMKPEKW